MKNISLSLLVIAALFIGCDNVTKKSKNATNDDSLVMVGGIKDEHGCNTSAGYTWSELGKRCIRPWEEGVKLTYLADTTMAGYVVFSSDSAKVELFTYTSAGSEVLDRRRTPSGGYVWNIFDDDTHNLTKINGNWQVTQRGNLIYKQ